MLAIGISVNVAAVGHTTHAETKNNIHEIIQELLYII